MNQLSPTILVVDDNPILLHGMSRALQKGGYQVLESDSAESAIQLWNDNPQGIDLLLTDIVMPGMNGLELVDLLRKENPKLKVLLVSGFLPDLLRPRVEGIEATAFLEKPFSFNSLLTSVRNSLKAAEEECVRPRARGHPWQEGTTNGEKIA